MRNGNDVPIFEELRQTTNTEITTDNATKEAFALGRRLGRHDAFKFCRQPVGVSRSYADRLIRCLEEFGPNYFHLSAMVEVSAATYRLLAPAVSDAGLEFEGQTIPLAAVESVRAASSQAQPSSLSFEKARKRPAAVKVAEQSIQQPHERLVLGGTLRSESRRIDGC